MANPLFFNREESDHAEEFRRCLPVNVNTSFATLAPAIATAEHHYLLPVLGDSLYNEAATYYANNGTRDTGSPLHGLVELIQMAAVRLAYWDSFDQLAVMIGDRGLSDAGGENRAYRYQADALRKSLCQQGFFYLNRVIEYCTDHIDALAAFATSPYYTQRQESVIHSLREFCQFVPVEGDFYLFSRLRSEIEETETLELPYRIGNSLATLLRTDRTQERLAQLLRPAQGFVAHWTMAECLPVLSTMLDADGLQVSTETGSGGRVRQPATPQQTEEQVRWHRARAERYIGLLVAYCKGNLALYPEIAEIGTTTDKEKTASARSNRGKKTFVA